jgi:hypothetical protein
LRNRCRGGCTSGRIADSFELSDALQQCLVLLHKSLVRVTQRQHDILELLAKTQQTFLCIDVVDSLDVVKRSDKVGEAFQILFEVARMLFGSEELLLDGFDVFN